MQFNDPAGMMIFPLPVYVFQFLIPTPYCVAKAAALLEARAANEAARLVEEAQQRKKEEEEEAARKKAEDLDRESKLVIIPLSICQ